jgi:hypothetical protein
VKILRSSSSSDQRSSSCSGSSSNSCSKFKLATEARWGHYSSSAGGSRNSSRNSIHSIIRADYIPCRILGKVGGVPALGPGMGHASGGMLPGMLPVTESQPQFNNSLNPSQK